MEIKLINKNEHVKSFIIIYLYPFFQIYIGFLTDFISLLHHLLYIRLELHYNFSSAVDF